ncbi:MAG: SLBB domain-containing protein [Candidatus Solibacter sp.]|nr:SLBB domain-containing protein [Candidatus Solibacter sp.]
MKLIVLLTLCAPLVQAQVRGTPNAETAVNLPSQATLQMHGSPDMFRGADPLVSITVSEYSSRPIRVAGAVKASLTFQTSGPVTLLEAITRAGGLTPAAGSVILVGKSQTGPFGQPGPLMQRVSVQALIDGTDPEANLRLTGGEEVHVPEAGRVFIVGNVKKPGAFRLPEGTATTVLTMLALAQGLEPFAGKQAYIHRRDASGGRNEIPVDLSRIVQGKGPDAALLANDTLYIPDSRNRRLGSVALQELLLFGVTAGAPALSYGAR